MKILIVKLSALGDIVHTVPVVDSIVHFLPQSEIDWVVEARLADLVRLHPLVRKVVEVDTRSWRSLEVVSALERGIFSSIRALCEERYDVVLDLQGNIKSGLVTFITGAPFRFGWPFFSVREWPNVLATNRKITVPDSVVPIRDRLIWTVENACRLLNGEKDETSQRKVITSSFRPHDEDVCFQRQQLIDAGISINSRIVGIHPGTTWDTKKWDDRRWKELVAYLTRGDDVVRDYDIGVVVFWGGKEEFRKAESLKMVNNNKVIVWRGGSLRDLTAALSLMDVFVGPDTGPLHLAALLGIPTVSFYRATDARRNAPSKREGQYHISLQSPLPCSPCMKKRCRNNESCSVSITPIAVYRSILDILNSTPLNDRRLF